MSRIWNLVLVGSRLAVALLLLAALFMGHLAANSVTTPSDLQLPASMADNNQVQSVNRDVPMLPVAPEAPADAPYIVRAGDTLSKIAAANGTTWQAICAHNGLANCHAIREGQNLALPGLGQPQPEFEAVAQVTQEASPAAQAAVQAALSKLGAPYQWGAEGPGSFDCSGLVYWAYQQAGITLSERNSGQMSRNVGTPVSRDELLPGDLIFQYSPVSHVVMYIGDGLVITAPESGKVVKTKPLADLQEYHSARRV